MAPDACPALQTRCARPSRSPDGVPVDLGETPFPLNFSGCAGIKRMQEKRMGKKTGCTSFKRDQPEIGVVFF